MSTYTWHHYGYGICTDHIKTESVDRLQQLLRLVPEFEAEINGWLKEIEVDAPTYEDYMDFDQDYHLGIATILLNVIKEAEGIEMLACDDAAGMVYLMFPPLYPWRIEENERGLTEEKIEEILRKYIAVLTDEEITIEYQSAENYG